MRATERAPSDPFHVLERRHGLVEIVDRGTGVHAERLRVNRPHFEREFMNLSKNAPRHGHAFLAAALIFHFANNGRAGAKLTTTRGVWQDD